MCNLVFLERGEFFFDFFYEVHSVVLVFKTSKVLFAAAAFDTSPEHNSVAIPRFPSNDFESFLRC
jgi:hypothetical protein